MGVELGKKRSGGDSAVKWEERWGRVGVVQGGLSGGWMWVVVAGTEGGGAFDPWP